jgi:hypothetical protein
LVKDGTVARICIDQYEIATSLTIIYGSADRKVIYADKVSRHWAAAAELPWPVIKQKRR